MLMIARARSRARRGQREKHDDDEREPDGVAGHEVFHCRLPIARGMWLAGRTQHPIEEGRAQEDHAARDGEPEARAMSGGAEHGSLGALGRREAKLVAAGRH